jgi:hypothetical protein
MSNVQNGCCDDGPAVLPSPKEEMRKRKSAHMPVLYELQNPIPEEIRDTEELSKLIDRLQLVPYAGTDKQTGHNTLNWYLMLAKLSPTHGAAIEKLTKYAVGGRAMFTRSENPDYDIGEETQPLSRSEKERYQAAITQFIEFQGGVRDYHRNLTASLKATGNAWVEMSIAERAGQRRVSFRFVKQQNVMYRRTDADEMRMAVISPIWTDAYLKKHSPPIIPLYPNFVKIDGVQKRCSTSRTGTSTGTADRTANRQTCTSIGRFRTLCT